MKILILFAMFFAHIVDDYYLQGILAKMKQKQWWAENANDKMYNYDYIVALVTHAFSWSFMVNFPMLLVCNKYMIMCIFIVVNTTIHAYVDNLKANKLCINLVQDQLCHILQIVVTWVAIILL